MKYSFTYLALILFCLAACTDNSVAPEKKSASFPDFFIEKGSDLDTSYISLRGINNNSHYEIQATGWGIWEYGLFLNRSDEPNLISYSLMGQCGTVLTRTWRKVTFNDLLTPEEMDGLQMISFTDFRDTVSVAFVSVH